MNRSFSLRMEAIVQTGEPLESTGEEQYEEDNDHYPDESRGAIAIRMIAKVGQSTDQEQN